MRDSPLLFYQYIGKRKQNSRMAISKVVISNEQNKKRKKPYRRKL